MPDHTLGAYEGVLSESPAKETFTVVQAEASPWRSTRALLGGAAACGLLAGVFYVAALSFPERGSFRGDISSAINEEADKVSAQDEIKVSVPITSDYTAGSETSEGAPAADEQLNVKRGVVVFVGETSRPGWMFVHDVSGGAGWVPNSAMTASVQQVYQDYTAGAGGRQPQLTVKAGEMAFMADDPTGDGWQRAWLIHNTGGYHADAQYGWLPNSIFFPADGHKGIPLKADTEYKHLVPKNNITD